MPQSTGHQCEPLMVCSAQGGAKREHCDHCGIKSLDCAAQGTARPPALAVPEHHTSLRLKY